MSTPSAVTNPAFVPRRRKLGELLVEAGVIDDLQLKAALSEQRKWGGRLGRTLVEMGFLTEDAMVKALSSQLQLPVVDLDRAEIPAQVTKLLRVDAAERYGVFPIGGDEKSRQLVVASSDPTNQEMLKELGFSTGMRISVQVAASTAIDRAIRRHYYGEKTLAANDVGAPAFGGRDMVLDLLDLPLEEKPGQAELEAKVQELTHKVTELEATLISQSRALRVLLEMALEKGVIGRDEYVARVRSAK